MNEIERIIKKSKIFICKGTYVIAKVQSVNTSNKHFMVSHDRNEITVITEEKNIPAINIINIEKDFKLLEINVCKPFNAPGFLASISSAIAAKGLNVFMVSTFSKDYILIKNDFLEASLDALSEVGFPIEKKNLII